MPRPEPTTAPLPVHRAPMPSDEAVARALAAGLCGVIGRLDPGSDQDAPVDPDDAVARVARAHDQRVADRLRRFVEAPEGCFVWTRLDGELHLGRLTGPWRYDASPAAYDLDLVHVRPCTWLLAPVDAADAPPAVLQTFARGGRNFQRTRPGTTPGDVEAETATLWAALTEPARGADRRSRDA